MEPSTVLALGSSIVQGIRGLIGGSSSRAEVDNLLAQRTPYKAPDEVYDILRAAQNNAQTGLDPVTLNYMTSQVDQSFAASLGSASRLGADPNALGALFEQKMNANFKIGSENHSANMARFSELRNAMGLVAENKMLEWKSEQDILKDKLQAKVGEMRSYGADVGNALNTAVGALAANETGNMFKSNESVSPSATAKPVFSPTGSTYTGKQWEELGSILNYKGDKSWASQALPYNDLGK